MKDLVWFYFEHYTHGLSWGVYEMLQMGNAVLEIEYVPRKLRLDPGSTDSTIGTY